MNIKACFAMSVFMLGCNDLSTYTATETPGEDAATDALRGLRAPTLDAASDVSADDSSATDSARTEAAADTTVAADDATQADAITDAQPDASSCALPMAWCAATMQCQSQTTTNDSCGSCGVACTGSNVCGHAHGRYGCCYRHDLCQEAQNGCPGGSCGNVTGSIGIFCCPGL